MKKKDLEQALYASESQLRLVVENSRSAIAIFDRQMRCLMGSRRWLRVTGRSNQELVGRSLYEVFPGISERWKALHARCLAGAIEHCDVDPFPCKDGTENRHRWSLYPWRDAIGEIGGIVMFSEVITENQTEPDELRESEAHYRSLSHDVLETLPVGISLIDAQHRVIWTNHALERFFDAHRYELVGADLLLFLRERAWQMFDNSGDKVKRVFEDASQDDDLEQYELRMPASETQEEQWLEIRSQRIRSGLHAGGRILQFYDITQRRQAETALREERNFVSAVLATIGALVIVLDRAGKVVRFNRACEAATGYTFAEVKGRSLWDLFLIPEETERVKKVFDELRTGLFPNRHVNHWRTKQGALRLIDWSNTSLVDEQGIPLYIIGTGIDITEQRAVEEALIQAQKMHELGQLTGGVAHDFNNLLTVVIGNLQMLEERIGEDPLCSKLLQGAHKASSDGAEMIRKLLAFSRKQRLEPTDIDLNDLLSASTDILRRAVGERIEILVVHGNDLWKAMADPAQLETTLLNLAINARDAMPHGGSLTIETANIHLDEAYAAKYVEVSAGEYVMLTVSDTGFGMSPEIVARAFDPFFTTKEAGKGSGLGLSMVYGFAMQSSGHVNIYSEPGIGTTIKLYLPRAMHPLERSAEPLAKTPVQPARGETVLVVEDDQSVRDTAVMLLSDLGYRVLDAVDGGSALEILEHDESIDLLFLDLVMSGGMSGADVAREVQRRLPSIKILLTTGYTETVVNHGSRLHAGIQLLPKPYTKEDLGRTLRGLLDNN